MKTRLHANATTTPRTRMLIQASTEPVAVLARRFGVSETTIRRWRGRTSTADRSHVRHNLGQGERETGNVHWTFPPANRQRKKR